MKLRAPLGYIALGLALAVAVGLAIGASWGHQPGSSLARVVNLVPIPQPGDLLNGRATVAIVVDPELRPTAGEASSLREFLYMGGRLIVIGSGAGVNELLRSLNSNITVAEGVVVNPTINAGTPLAPLATFRNFTIALFNASPLELGPGAEPLIEVPPNSRILVNGTLEGNGSYVVAAYQQVGAGKLIVISDPYIASGGLLSQADNSNALKLLINSTDAYLVEFLWLSPPLQVFAQETLHFVRSLEGQALVALLLTAVVVLYHARPPTAEEVEDEVDALLRLHPDWDREKLIEIARERSLPDGQSDEG
ncbi:hypothetical protein ASAC_1347 [Acidilobus saccharovorans 345-15]|uniref:DUF4350 domain-containing protein n=1 Tax=Acidilobus saccharovorans (strain DSM 16705 / JCM 18335 / VKM B-2471 / 345-15) TaxID=666510 RepID=D9Q364_ACIS3|nr:DUF4350 domain-containing protein [Acidilobus saccharovorans]ADL19752.1 hypothetical protein ASAC_1347 [Acidilobus saccharovorans 345-15]